MAGRDTEYNAKLYDKLWEYAEFHEPERLPWWPVLQELSQKAPRRLEVGPGLYPRLAIRDTHVVDLSPRTLTVLSEHGAIAHQGYLYEIAFPDASFDLVGMFEVLEHIEDDQGALRELARIIRPGGCFAISVPLGMRYFSEWDRFAGHVRRYEPEELRRKLERAGFDLERFEVHDEGADGLGIWLMPWVIRIFPRFGVWLLKRFAVLTIYRLKLEWVDARQWEDRSPSANVCTLICKRREG